MARTLTPVIFDFGAVVFRWQPVELLRELLPQRCPDVAAAEALQQAFFQGFSGAWGAYDRGELEGEALVEALVAQTGLSAAEARTVVEAVPESLQPLPGTVVLIERLRAAGHRLHYLSNMPGPIADHLEATHGFLAVFSSGVFSSREKLAKPEPAIFALAQRRFGLAPGEGLFIDDHPANVEAAERCGLPALRFTDAAQLERDLRSRGLLV